MLTVIDAGFFTSIQDKGRYYNRGYGVPVSGYLDAYSAQFANLVLGNKNNEAVLEITMKGPELCFHSPTQIAISGAFMKPEINGNPVPHNQSITITSNDILRFHSSRIGIRCYLAVKGGFNTEIVLGSRSYYESITESSKISKGDALPYCSINARKPSTLSRLKFNDGFFSDSILEVYNGPEYDFLNENVKNKLLKGVFTISKYHNRMAYQFNELIPNLLENILTGPVMPGTIQLTPSGQLIALMKDCQTTGGYPRIFQLTQEAMTILSQKSLGKSIKFRLIE